ncbi:MULTISPECIES: AEC family transporter [unclassified Halomonas]|uniref:AEC family transporter n=1 Tax=unclassified Halomonas TaxID=2609666 RepID=UPI001CF51EE8|nr:MULTISPECIES: AEC family transporter [unclassified Halomonas]MCA8864349.1 AEC family transporter [Halomonas sp. SBBP1]UZH10037.1 AEC family transporter [Halomonas sp. BDJS001]
MLEIFGITSPLFMLVGLGYLSKARGLIDRAQVQGIGTFVIQFAIPALILRALAQRPLGEVFSLYYFLAVGLGSLVLFVAAIWVARRWRRKSLADSALYALGMSVANSGFIGYPVAAMVLGSPAVVALALNMIIENLLMIPLALALAEAGSQSGTRPLTILRQTAMRLALNPIILAILIGTSLSASGAGLPLIIYRVVDLLAQVAAPMALFVIGGNLHGLKANGMTADISQVVIGKLILHPLLILTMFMLLPAVDPPLVTAAVLIACAPMLSIYPIFGQRFGQEGLTAATLLAATLVSFFTLSLAIWLMQHSQYFVG